MVILDRDEFLLVKLLETEKIVTEENRASGWNYQPSESIKYNPLFDFPPKLNLIIRWMVKRWVSISRFVLFLILAFILTNYLMPSLSIMREFDYGWVTYLFMRNAALLFLVAGTLHLYLHMLKVQGDDYKFLKKEMAKNSNSEIRSTIMYFGVCSAA